MFHVKQSTPAQKVLPNAVCLLTIVVLKNMFRLRAVFLNCHGAPA